MNYSSLIFTDPEADLLEKTAAPIRFVKLKYAQPGPVEAVPAEGPAADYAPMMEQAPPQLAPAPPATQPTNPHELLLNTIRDFGESPVVAMFMKPAQPLPAPSQMQEVAPPDASAVPGQAPMGKFAATPVVSKPVKVKIPAVPKKPVIGPSAQQMAAWEAPKAHKVPPPIPVPKVEGKVDLNAERQALVDLLGLSEEV